MKTVLVTGISGFVGGHVALAALQAGHRVRGSLRSMSRADTVRAELADAGADTDGLQIVALDLMKDDGWAEAMDGVDVLHHVASPFVIAMPENPDDLIRPAVEGTERALAAALAAGVGRIVVTSSFAAVGFGHPSVRTEPFSENDWTNLDSAIRVTAYVRSKTLAERRAWEMMARAGRETDLVTVNPVNIYGPLLGADIGTSGLLVRRLFNGSVPAMPRLIFPSVDVRDVAALHMAAMDIPAAGGQRILASAGPLGLPDMARLLRKTFPETSRRVPRIVMPDWMARIYALFDKELRDNAEFIGMKTRVNAGRAQILLGRPLIGAEQAFLSMARTMIERGLI
ncbi:MAG: NAD-dependent epimerase/dehydratase family protein [Alphaproteobacteria bacterium]|nr:NAD-dependent epimerase/dehydratase family protein [Alphaproteobacteria bacterium]